MTTVEERPERVEQFKEEIASMRLRDPATARDRQLLWLGVGLMKCRSLPSQSLYPYASIGGFGPTVRCHLPM